MSVVLKTSWWIGAVILLAATTVHAQSASVEFELCTEPDASPTAAQQWLAALKDLDLSGLRVRAATGDDRPEVKKRGTAKAPSYLVVGIIKAGGTVSLPGGSFSMNDQRRLAEWIRKLKAGGQEELGAKRGAFGMTSSQLVALHDALAVNVPFATKGEPVGNVVKKIAGKVSVPVSFDAAAARVLTQGDAVIDELQGVSAGTALAAALRPLGLVLVPGLRGNQAELRVTPVRQAEESWPIGWPGEQGAGKSAPQLLKLLEVEIEDTPLSEALDAIQQRVKIPFLLDHNGLARQKIDLDQINVKLPKSKTFYGKILDRLLAQGRLSWELRVDEASSPLIWISPAIK